MRAINLRHKWIYAGLAVCVIANISFWFYSNNKYVKWPNVPVAPSAMSFTSSHLGDEMMAYRNGGLMLQNFGSIGEVQALKDYDFDKLSTWFYMLDRLDPKSRYVPYLAAYYFSATQEPKELGPLLEYLISVGIRDAEGGWRWMAEAAHIARHRMKDMDKALEISGQLGAMWKPGMPTWTQNMKPLLMAKLGDRDAAYLFMLHILKSSADQMTGSEYQTTLTILCQDILTKEQAFINELCK